LPKLNAMKYVKSDNILKLHSGTNLQ